jgi:hypothetical protein
MSVAPGRIPGIEAIAEGGGTSDTVALATAAPSLLITLPLTDVCADAADTTNRITALVTATRILCMFLTVQDPPIAPPPSQADPTHATSGGPEPTADVLDPSNRSAGGLPSYLKSF